VESGKRENELGELTPSNLMAFSGGDLFSQIWILPGGVTRDCFVRTCLKPLLFEIEEVTVESGKRENELGELTPSNLLAFSGGDLFSQIWILPGGDFFLGWPEFYG
jgi:hypothetical protein